MRHAFIAAAVVATLVLGATRAEAATISGYLNDPGNVALRGWLPDPADGAFGLSAPSFLDDFDIANNVALYVLTLPGGLVQVESRGFAPGGVDPYFTLFSGSGPGATVVGSNYDQAFGVGGDFLLSFNLAPGDYIFAIGAFANMSLAENLGGGTLSDGFIGLGGPDFLGTTEPYYYELEVTSQVVPVPEPATLLLFVGGASAVLARVRRHRR